MNREHEIKEHVQLMRKFLDEVYERMDHLEFVFGQYVVDIEKSLKRLTASPGKPCYDYAELYSDKNKGGK